MCEQDEMRQESGCFTGAKAEELCDEIRTRGIGGTVDWARLDAEARKITESGIELASLMFYRHQKQSDRCPSNDL